MQPADSKRVDELLVLGIQMQANNHRALAEKYFLKAIEVAPESYEARFRWAAALLRFGDISEGEQQAREAIRIGPSAPPAYELLGALLSQKGSMSESAEAYATAVALNPRPTANAFHGLVSNRKLSEQDRPLIDRILSFIETEAPDLRSELILQVSLGKALDDLGDYEACMRHYALARQLAARQPGVRRINRREAAFTADNFERVFTKEVLAGASRGADSELPIFVIGMPRSGSTLVEQILSCHPEVGAAGEIDYWRSTPIAIEPRKVFDPAFAGEQAVHYRRTLRGIGPTKKRVVDKTLPNYALMGPLHVLFPNARFIHCRRHPIDTCLSIAMNTLLLRRPPDYVYDLDDLVFAYRLYERQMAHWWQVLPAKCLLEVDYEEIVSHPEAVSRQMIDFCGLPWDDACNRPEENDRRVDTLSRWQVRQPVYRSSVERWRRYEPWLGPLKALIS